MPDNQSWGRYGTLSALEKPGVLVGGMTPDLIDNPFSYGLGFIRGGSTNNLQEFQERIDLAIVTTS